MAGPQGIAPGNRGKENLMTQGKDASPGDAPGADVRALTEAFESFTETTQAMEEAYRRLEDRLEMMDRELAERNRELAFTRDYLNDILESMSDGVIAVDADGMVTAFNRAAGDVLGVDAHEVLNQPFREVFQREFEAPPDAKLQELPGRRGRNVTVMEQDSPILDRDRARLGTVKIFQDLTEIEALRNRMQQQERLAAIGEMAATVAHEIRNPLGGMRGFASLLARDIDDEDPRKRLVEKILRGSQHLERVVNELLEFTRPVQLRARATSLAEVVESALGYLEWDPERITVDRQHQEDAMAVADPDQLRQVLLNILINALQSIDGTGTVTLSVASDEHWAWVRVADSGCGMDEETLRKVFSPFFTTKEKGTGLGLAVAAKIVEAHGGKLSVESEAGRGATFTIQLTKAEGF